MPILNQNISCFSMTNVWMFPVKQVLVELIHLLKEVQRKINNLDKIPDFDSVTQVHLPFHQTED